MFLFFWQLYLRTASADRRENFTRDWKYVHLDNIGPKIGGGGQLLFTLRPQISSDSF